MTTWPVVTTARGRCLLALSYFADRGVWHAHWWRLCCAVLRGTRRGDEVVA